MSWKPILHHSRFNTNIFTSLLYPPIFAKDYRVSLHTNWASESIFPALEWESGMLLLQKWHCLAWVMLCKPRKEMRGSQCQWPCWFYCEHGIWCLGMSVAHHSGTTPLVQPTFENRRWAWRSLWRSLPVWAGGMHGCSETWRGPSHLCILQVFCCFRIKTTPSKSCWGKAQHGSQYSCWSKHSLLLPHPQSFVFPRVAWASFHPQHGAPYCFLLQQSCLKTLLFYLSALVSFSHACFCLHAAPFGEEGWQLLLWIISRIQFTAMGGQNAMWEEGKTSLAQGNLHPHSRSWQGSIWAQPGPPKNNLIPNIWAI